MTDVPISSQGGPTITLYRGFQLQKKFEFHFRVRCAIEENSCKPLKLRGVLLNFAVVSVKIPFYLYYYFEEQKYDSVESAAFQYSLGHHHFVIVYPLNGNDSAAKYYIDEGISKFIHIRKHHLYVASCMDLTLRVFTEHFELIKVIEFAATVLSFVFDDETSMLYLGGLGYIQVWSVKHSLQDAITFGMEISCSINDRQRIISLNLDHDTKKLIATCQDTVFVIDMKTHTEMEIFPKTQRASLTCAVFFAPMNYLITGARDGSIKVWSYLLHREIHTYTGHAKPISAIQIHPFAPCFLSCSRDGTLRCWHLEAMNECFRVQTGEELLGMYSNFPCGNKILCCSHKKAYVLAIFQPEKYFITLNSNVLKLTTVTCNDKSKILALAEDGGARLIAPTSGDVISTLLPVFPSEGVQDVVCNIHESMIYVLLKSGRILVHSCNTNPCVTLENWVPSNSEEDIICIALVSLYDMMFGIIATRVSSLKCTINRPKLSSLLFGGLRSGYITLLHGTGLSMLYQQPAHYGCIIAMKSCQKTMMSSADLVSLGDDNILKLWMIHVNENENQYVITLKCIGSIHLEPHPCHFELLGSTLCLVYEEKKVDMLDIEILKASSSVMEYRNIPVLTHQAEDDHVGMITSLASSLQLGLFATCSVDGHIKLWNKENNMVTEIGLGHPLASVSFGSDQGELVVGIQKDLYLVMPLDYLPPNYHHLVRGKVDDREISRPFDSNVEFWYDPSRIPSLPIHQSMRQKLKNTEDQFFAHVSDQEINYAERNGDISTNATITLKASQQLIPSTIVTPAKLKAIKVKQSCHLHEGTKMTSDIAIQPVTNAMDHTIVHHTVEMSSSASKLLPTSLPNDIHSIGAAFLQPLATDQALQSKYPIAPDCLIPNSVIRGKMRVKTCSGTIESQSSTFIPTFNEAVLKKTWKRKSFHHFVPILKVPPLELLPSIVPSREQISPVVLSPIPSPCLSDKAVHSGIEDELEPSQEAVQFVFSESWKAARDCLRVKPQIQNIEKCNDNDSTSVEARSSFTAGKEETLQDISVQQSLCISSDQHIVNHPIGNSSITDGPDLSTPTHGKTFDTLLLKLATASDVPTFNDARNVLLDMRRKAEFNADEELAVAHKLLFKLKSNEDAAMIIAELKCIQELDIANEVVLVGVLPYLMDPRDDVRQNAFETLKGLTGITARAQLHSRLVEIGVLKNVIYDEDEILQGVADRLKNGEVQKIPKLLALDRVTAENGMMELCHQESVSDSFTKYCSDYHQPQRKSISGQPTSAGSILQLHEEFMNEKQNKNNFKHFTAAKKPFAAEKGTRVSTLPLLVNAPVPNVARVKIKHPDDMTHHGQLSPTLQNTSTNEVIPTPPSNRTAIPLLIRNRLEAYSNHELSGTTNLPLHDSEEASIRPIAKKENNMGCSSSEMPKQLNLIYDSAELNSSTVIPHEGERKINGELKVHSTATPPLFKTTIPNVTLTQTIMSKFQSWKLQMLCSKPQAPVSSDFKHTQEYFENHTPQQQRGIAPDLGPRQIVSRSSEGELCQRFSVSHTSLNRVALAPALDDAKGTNTCIQLNDASLMEEVVLPNSGIDSQSIANRQHETLQVSINSHVPILKASMDSMRKYPWDRQYVSQECGSSSLKATPTIHKGSCPLNFKTKPCDTMHLSGFQSSTNTSHIAVSDLKRNATSMHTSFQLSNTTRYSTHLTRIQSPSRIHPMVRLLLKEQSTQKGLVVSSRTFSWKDVFVSERLLLE